MMTPALIESDQASCTVRRTAAGRRRILTPIACKILLASFIFVIGGELASRMYWCALKQAPLLARDTAWLDFYPQLRSSGVRGAAVANTDSTYDVLILGGSTVSPEFGSIGTRLQETLARRLDRPVRVFNLAFAAHNSRDSMFKHRLLADQRFDLVIVYDGINDTRMNNTPPGRFHTDYRHCHWYANLQFIADHPWLTQSSLVFTSHFAAGRIAEELGLIWYVPRHSPPAQLREHARDCRTQEPFRRHYGEILAGAKERGEKVVLMTFAYHIPTDYRLADSEKHRAADPLEVGLWGEPKHVAAGIDAHNTAIRELAKANPHVVFVDQQRLLPRTGEVFRDCCHLTEAGCARFVDNILAKLDEPH